MIEYLDKIEMETYGEVRSQIILDKITLEYEAIKKNNMIH